MDQNQEPRSNSTHLQAAEIAIRHAGRPLSSRELVHIIEKLGLSEFTGATPHKTINARLSEDILKKGENSVFMRTAQGRFSLREYGWESEVTVARRTISPLDEDIKVISKPVLESLLVRSEGRLLSYIDRTGLIKSSFDMPRVIAEEDTSVVQLIPSFVIRNNNCILTFQRTRKIPEPRLRATKSINFGGHLQSDDFPPLFARDLSIVDLFMMRELHEELRFVTTPKINFLGAVYLTDTEFERQHIGIAFIVDTTCPEEEIVSVEPGYHTNLKFEMIPDLIDSIGDIDSWSKVLLREVSALNDR